MDRVIIHSDANCFYASVEMLYHPELAGKPLAVGGDPEARHGIVLTANYIAKKHADDTVWLEDSPGLSGNRIYHRSNRWNDYRKAGNGKICSGLYPQCSPGRVG